MKLLLDEMWSDKIAIQLRARGYGVIAATERVDLRTKPDEAIFSAAQSEGRVLVTDNLPDFRRLLGRSIQSGQTHPGLILTTNKRFPRHDPRTIGRMVRALHKLLSTDPDLTNRELWLE